MTNEAKTCILQGDPLHEELWAAWKTENCRTGTVVFGGKTYQVVMEDPPKFIEMLNEIQCYESVSSNVPKARR